MTGLRYIDVCSGISAPTMAWKPLGWKALCFAEIEAAPRSILAHHYPDVPLRGDFTEIQGTEYGPVDLLVGGTPCQSFSIAGLRGGLGDDRGNLALEFLKLAGRARPRWVVWENVPGVFSSLSHDAPDTCPPEIDLDSGDGPADGEEVVVEDSYDAIESHALGCFLAGLQELGYGAAYRVLDAQYAGVPQRRRRIFVVGYLGDWRRAAAVLFERHGLSGHSAPRREKGPVVAALTADGVGTCGADDNQGQAGHLLHCEQISRSLTACNTATGRLDPNEMEFVAFNITPSNSNKDFNARESERAQALTAGGNRPSARGGDLVCFSAKDHGADAMHDLSPTLRAGGHSGSHANAGVMPAIAFAQNSRDEVRIFGGDGQSVGALAAEPGMKQQSYVAFDLRGREGGSQFEGPHDSANLRAASGGSSRSYVAASAVRRLTPRECERLQGFPDDFTLVPHRGKPMADGPRYKALGNSMAVPVLRWIGERIEMVESLATQSLAA